MGVVVRNLEAIRDASKNTPREIRDMHPMVPYEEMYFQRDKRSQAYFGIDDEILWDVASTYLFMNISQIEEIMNNE